MYKARIEEVDRYSFGNENTFEPDLDLPGRLGNDHTLEFSILTWRCPGAGSQELGEVQGLSLILFPFLA